MYMLSKSEYFVMDMKNFSKLQSIINWDEADYLRRPVKTPKVGIKCVTMFDDAW